jgi:hypothetical protein
MSVEPLAVNSTDVWVNVAPPPVVERPFGLFSVAPPTEPGDSGWQLGIQWRRSPGCARAATTLDPCVSGTSVGPKVPTGCPDLKAFKPFTVYLYLQRAGIPVDVVRAEVEEAFDAAEERGVESFVWNSEFDALAVDVGSFTDPAVALGVAERELRNRYNGTGVIHTDSLGATLVADRLRVEGSQLLTMLGTPVVVGAGYVGATPDNTEVSYVATGALVARRDAREILEGFDRAINDALFIAERTYVVGWDCAAVRTTATIGGGP